VHGLADILNDSYPKIRSLIPKRKGQEKGHALLKGDDKRDFYMSFSCGSNKVFTLILSQQQ
jgi:hypothetical protein